jgi:hypothetical protein
MPRSGTGLAEVSRLLAADDDTCVFIGSAQHADARIG